jgi:hypothetical protein
VKKPLRFAWPETARVVLSQLDWMSILDHSATTGNYIFDSEVCLGVDQVIEGIYYHSLPTWARSVCGLVVVDYLYVDSRHIRYFAIFRHLMMMIGGIVVLWGVLKGHIVDRWLKKG